MNMNKNLKILFVEDIKADAELIWWELRNNQILFEKLLVDNKKDFLAGIQSFSPDLIISDFSLPQFDGMKALILRNEHTPLTPFILVTGSINEEVAVECMKAGADDYILKENLARLGPAVVKSLNKIKLLKQKNNAEKALRESEERFRVLYNDAVVGLYRTNLQGEILLANATLVKMLGFKSFEELAERNLKETGYGPTYQRQQFIEQIEKEGVVKDLEAIWVCKDGREIFVRESAKAICDPDGKVIYYDGTVQNITEAKLAEEALRKSELRFKQISENFGEWIWEVDARGLYTYSSPIVKEILGFEPEELINKKYFYDLFTPDVRDKLKQGAMEAFSSKESFRNFINPNLHKDGRVVILSTSGLPLVDTLGNLIGYRGVDTDITDQQRADEALQHSLSFSKSLLKTIPFGMDIVDESGSVLFQSENFKRIFGEEAIGRKCWELYRDDKKQCEDCPLRKGINIGDTEAYESHGVLGNRIFEINYTGMLYEGKKAMLEIFQDITDRKIDEAELISAKEKAEEGDRLKTAFLHNISHEIRTPMNAIVGFSALLGGPDTDEQTRKSYIDIIMQGSNHLLSIITDIVDFSNIEANLVKITKNELNINSAIKSLCNQFFPVADEKNIKLICENGLADTDAVSLTDGTKLTQILSNLINNALKFTDSGSITVGYKVADRFLEFIVSDTGIGIPDEDHKRIFDRFYQVHNSVSRLYEGTGLGLAISRAYVELMGGKIWLSSELGKGTSFYFTIPYEKPAIPSMPAIEKTVIKSFVFSKKRKILVAEDIDSNFKLIGYFLAGTNADLLRAHNGKEALEMCKAENDVDLVLMDIKMPVMDGYTAARLIREAGLKIPIIAQTAYADDMDKAIESGCSGFISKPFDRKGLLFKISEFI